MSSINIFRIALLCIVSGSSSCVADHSRSVAEGFFTSFPSSDAQISNISSYDANDQISIFLFGNHSIHPPAVYLADPIARQGAKINPTLQQRLGAADDDETVRNLALILKSEASLESYNFSNNPELVDLLAKKVEAMRGPSKALALQWLHAIQFSRI